MGAVCPACKVAIVPGYVRCPKCHRPLPVTPRRVATSTIDPGGTAMSQRGRVPIGAIAFGVAAVLAIVAVIVMRGKSHASTPAAPPAETPAASTEVAAPAAPSIAPTATPRLALRPIELADVDAIWPYASDPEFPKQMSWAAHVDRSETVAFIESCDAALAKETSVTWAITKSGQTIGCIGLDGIAWQVRA